MLLDTEKMQPQGEKTPDKKGEVLSNLGRENVFNLSYSPKGEDMSQMLSQVLLMGNLTRYVRYLKEDIQKNFEEGKEILVLARMPISLKLTQKVLEIISLYQTNPKLAQQKHYSELTMDEGTKLGAIVRQFPDDLKRIHNLFSISEQLGFSLRQRFDMSGKGYGMEIYIASPNL